MLEGHTYNAELLVAQGKKPVDGTDGYYEYKFDTNFDGKPKLLPDGSVDYWSVHSIESVTAGQVIAVSPLLCLARMECRSRAGWCLPSTEENRCR